MSGIAIFTLTKDRVEYTKRMIESLNRRTKLPFTHYIVDQGSNDGTVEYLASLKNKYPHIKIYPLGTNIGINKGVNFAVDRIRNVDIIIKLDNDTEIETDCWLCKCTGVLERKMLLSPYVKGLIDNRGGVDRIGFDKIRNIGFTPFIGGICMIGHRKAWNEDSGGWEYPSPKHAGGDKQFCHKLYLSGYKFGYKEDVVIKHIDDTLGQAEANKEYFDLRKDEKFDIM